MLRIITGIKTLDLIYEKVKKSRGILITPFEGTYTILKDIKIENPTVKHIVLTLILKLFKVNSEEYSIIRDVIRESQTLREFFTKLEEYNFRDINLNYLIDLYNDITLTNESEHVSEYLAIRTWISDPQLSFLAVVALISVLRNYKDLPILLYLIDVENILDILLMFRRYELYVFSLKKPTNLENFDEIYLYNIPRLIDKYGIIKIHNENILKCKEPSMNVLYSEPRINMRFLELDNVSKEILSTLSELGFMSLNALRESIAHQFGIDKSIVDSCVLKLERLGLVELRYLPDGRVIVLPTLIGLVKAKKLG